MNAELRAGIRARQQQGATREELMREFNVCRATVYAACTGLPFREPMKRGRRRSSAEAQYERNIARWDMGLPV